MDTVAEMPVITTGKGKARRQVSPEKVAAAAGDDPVLLYAQQVLAGIIVAGPHVRAACRRHLLDLATGHARGLVWDLAAALHYIAFIESFLRLNGGEFEGRPFLLDPSQKFIAGSIFGWKWKATGLRRFVTAYIEMGKGNGKSPFAAAIGYCGLIVDDEPRAEIYAAASKKDQAMILFRDAVAMADQSPEISARLVKSGVGERCWNLGYPARGSFFRPISSDDGQSGPRPHVSLVDEIHEHKDGQVLDMLRRGFKGRRQPLIVEITNSGVDRRSICYLHHEASIAAVRAEPGQQGFDDTWFSYVCALDACVKHGAEGTGQPEAGCPDCDDWETNEACWVKANPLLGVSMPRKTLRDSVTEARNFPSKRNVIARLHFCQWTESVSAWIGYRGWMAVEDHAIKLADMTGRPCTWGLDLSQIHDLTALALFFPDDKGGGDLFAEFWTPAEGIAEREKRDRAPYTQWVREGWLHATPGAVVSYASVAERLGELQQLTHPGKAGFDRYRMPELKRELEDQEIKLPLVEFGQGFKSMTPAIDALETMIGNRAIRIAYHPIMRWNAASAVVVSPTKDEKKFAKQKATGRIDGVVAGAIAVGVANVAVVKTKHSQAFVNL